MNCKIGPTEKKARTFLVKNIKTMLYLIINLIGLHFIISLMCGKIPEHLGSFNALYWIPAMFCSLAFIVFVFIYLVMFLANFMGSLQYSDKSIFCFEFWKSIFHIPK